ncbi:11606_t:CDS:2 [Entrophospora sp. SA101]|nr:11606_t:CDS:2 [Entrophospora sp. SA101]
MLFDEMLPRRFIFPDVESSKNKAEAGGYNNLRQKFKNKFW